MKNEEKPPKNVPQHCMECMYHPINTQIPPEFPSDREEITTEKELKKVLDNIKHGRVPDDLYPIQQEIRKILQSTLYHGYGIISAELDILTLFKAMRNGAITHKK